VACGDMLEAMARITPSQPSDAMARIASRRNRTISLDPNHQGQISERLFRDSLDVNLRYMGTKNRHRSLTGHRSAQFYVQPSSGFFWIPPVVRRLFEVHSEPHTGARPLVRFCVGLIKEVCFVLCCLRRRLGGKPAKGLFSFFSKV
jgi:hypothetical protein